MKQQAPGLHIILLSGQEAREKLEELSNDPMGAVLASLVLLVPAYQELIGHIRSKLSIEETPVEIEDRMRWLNKRLSQKELRKIWREGYRLVGEMPELRKVPELLEKLSETVSLLKDFMPPTRKPGRPAKKKPPPYPQADMTNMVMWWAIHRILVPLPEYFYNPGANRGSEGVAFALALLSAIHDDLPRIVHEGGLSGKPATKKRNRERDAYLYLLKNEDEAITYPKLARYIFDEGLYEDFEPQNENEEYEFLEKLTGKYSTACNRHMQYISGLTAQNI